MSRDETPETVHWLETLNAYVIHGLDVLLMLLRGTGWFDQAFTENVIDSLAFDYNNVSDEDTFRSPIDGVAPDRQAQQVDWHYIDGGSSVLITNVLRKLESLLTGKDVTGNDFPNVMQRIKIGKRVTKMSRDDKVTAQPVTISFVDEADQTKAVESAKFDVVFCSTTLGAMQKMDLIGLELPYDTKAAIRSLRYDASTKVGIKFKSQWWVQDYGIRGGLGKTDMPLRTW